MLKIQGHKPGQFKRSMEFRQLSESNTLLAQIRNLLEERGISIPPSIQEGIDGQLELYEKRLDMEIGAKKRELESDLDSVKRTIELLREKDDLEAVSDLQKLKNGINREIQQLESLNGADILADPEWT